MALILTFLGKGGTGKTTIAIAAAKQLAAQGKRVLLAFTEPASATALLLGTPIGSTCTEVAANLEAVVLHSTELLEKSWEEVKKLEAQYVRTPFFKSVYGQELGILPGMDSALALNAIREYEQSGKYDAIVYDGAGDRESLRMLGIPEIASWYIRRFRQVFIDSDLGKNLSPFLGPISSAVLNVDLTQDNFSGPTKQVNNILDDGKEAIANPQRVAAYLVTTGDPVAIATARYLWGSAQQVGLTVGGVILNKSVMPDTEAAEAAASLQDLYQFFDRELTATDTTSEEFVNLPVSIVPYSAVHAWEPIMAALPNLAQTPQSPAPLTININERKVTLFLPGFDKKQVKLTQYGPELTIEAGDQRRNILLPPQLSGKPVTGAKFQEGYLIVSF
ncbi:ArsA family ATPase [Desertifilum sp. FACHB-1129]|uniref:Arsenic-transporting ATPase n=1 Tax=Desertifilum tharense IPPAS B-1220 TaxID=1781255 RepID=A0A1E5QG08_9CYAN|nr:MULTISPECIES: ArsA family ATPase [Desertifilum]MCD8490350.1 ArsA family ATPase [Desertifilum sp.]MDA0213285.1 ArsA family ATPase [Cyanobacteria bacterium FC1]MBD2310346.1 ArsA family ATPase [Desertifilum sp. FACHB-1129]MBD2321797.1 ArsA family ATPase [Desertifilum sp. FACHB-866]MBD2331924.1 ArsA family ATPase [Desertifilum sp. FACHB-868]